MDRFDVFAGGCITYRYAFAAGASSLLVFDADQALTFQHAAERLQSLFGESLDGRDRE